MEEQATSLLATLQKASATPDAKLAAFNELKSSIRHQRVPESSQMIIFECIESGISAQTSPMLVAAAFSTLGSLIKRLSLQEQASAIVGFAPRLLPIFQERLGDGREKVRNTASQSLSDLWPYAKTEVERVIREGGLGGHNARAKEVAMLWIVKMNQTDHLPFKAFVPSLVDCLEDADGGVRETAKSCVVELFKSAPEHAKADLKRQMTAHAVRKTIFSFISQHLEMGMAEPDVPTSTISTADHGKVDPLNQSIVSEHGSMHETTALEPLYVHTQRDLDDSFRAMMPIFEGKETEHNWSARDKAITKLRQYLLGNAPVDFHSAFLPGIKSMLDGLVRATNTLRTTMSTNACRLVQELYSTFGAGMDPMTEIMMQNFIKMSANTKHIACKNAHVTMQVMLAHCTFNHRIVQHMSMSFGEKNVQTRSLAPSWLMIILERHSGHKAQLEQQGGLDLIEKCLRKGLEDASVKVRENTRSCFWAFFQIWPAPADRMLASLDAKARTALEKDSHNPNKAALSSSVSGAVHASASASVSGASSTRPKTAAATVRPSVRDAIAAQRRAAVGGMPERPSSAQSILTPTHASTSNRPIRPAGPWPPPSAHAHSKSGVNTDANHAAKSHSTNRTLTAAPVRRPAPRGAEISRPATADPYASRRHGPIQQTTPTISPRTSPHKMTTAAKNGNAMASRTVTGRTPNRHPRATTPASRSRPAADITFTSSPQPIQQRNASPPPSPTDLLQHENMTLVMPLTNPHPPLANTSQVHGHDTAQNDHHEASTPILAEPGEHLVDKACSRPSSILMAGKQVPSQPSPLQSSGVSNPIDSSAKSQFLKSSGMLDTSDCTKGGAVRVYEDPFITQDPSPSPTKQMKPVLAEIVVNERPLHIESDRLQGLALNGRTTRQNDAGSSIVSDHHKTTGITGLSLTHSASPLTQPVVELMKAKRLLTSAIDKTRAKSLDMHGFRKLQQIIKAHKDIWREDERKYGQLLLALLDYFIAPADALATPATSSSCMVHNLKSQILATIRTMLNVHSMEAKQYYSRALCSILYARRFFDNMSHITSEMEKVMLEIIDHAQPAECIDAVLSLLATESSSSDYSDDILPTPIDSQPNSPHESSDTTPQPCRTRTMSLTALAHLLSSCSVEPCIGPVQAQSLGLLAVRFLQDHDPEVRRADLDLCLALYERLGSNNGEAFWRVVDGAKESSLNLITYYLARRGKI